MVLISSQTNENPAPDSWRPGMGCPEVDGKWEFSVVRGPQCNKVSLCVGCRSATLQADQRACPTVLGAIYALTYYPPADPALQEAIER